MVVTAEIRVVTRDDKIWTKTARDDKESHYTGRDVTKRVTLGDI